MVEPGPVASPYGTDSILDTIDVPIIIIGRDCKVTGFNHAATVAFDITASDIGRHPCNMLALAGVHEIELLCLQVMGDGLSVRHEFRKGDRWFILHVAPYPESDIEGRGTVLTFTNVTGLRASIAQAIYEREYTKTILNAVMDPLVVLDSDLQVQTANRTFYDWFGLSREKMQAIRLDTLGQDDWKTLPLWAALQAALSNHDWAFQPLELECHFPRMGRRTIVFDARRLAKETNSQILLMFRDITQRRLAEDALRQSEAHLRMFFESMEEGYCVMEVICDELNNPVDYRFLGSQQPIRSLDRYRERQGQADAPDRSTAQPCWFEAYGRVARTGETVRFETRATAQGRDYKVCAFRIGGPELSRVGVIFSEVTQPTTR